MSDTWQDFTGGEFLAREDVPDPIAVKIAGVGRYVFEEEPKKPKLRLDFEGDVKSMICNKTNVELLKAIFPDAAAPHDLIGKTIEVYDDPLIMFGGKVVGGLRIRRYDPPKKGKTDPDNPPF